MRRQMLAAAVAAAALAALIAVASQGSGPHASLAAARPDAVASTVRAFGSALRAGDFRSICDNQFTPAARDALGGSSCAAMLAANGQLLSKPRVGLVSASVHGGTATATIAVRQQRGPVATEILQLQRQNGGYRIAGVLSPGD